jgi:hypothetical protein
MKTKMFFRWLMTMLLAMVFTGWFTVLFLDTISNYKMLEMPFSEIIPSLRISFILLWIICPILIVIGCYIQIRLTVKYLKDEL